MNVSLGLGLGLTPAAAPLPPFSLFLGGRRLSVGGAPLVMR